MVNNVFAQQFVEGNVYELDKKGEEVGLPGVNVYWLGTTLGSATNIDGYFKLDFPDNNNRSLIISYIGFKKDTVHIADNFKNPLKIILSSSQQLEEVVVAERAMGTHISRIKPIATQIITTAELCKAACCNLAESFETNASVDVSYSDAVSGTKQIKMLGLAGKYSQLMTENIPNFKGLATTYGLDYVPGPWMESIQISKGTASVKNGYESITGQINIEFFKPENSDPFFFNAYTNDLGKLEANAYTTIKLSEKVQTLLLLHGEDFSKKKDKNGDGFMEHPMKEQFNIFNRWKYTGKNVHIIAGFKILGEERNGGQMSYDDSKPRNTLNGYGMGSKSNRFEMFTKTAFIFNNKKSNIAFINSFIYHDQKSFYGLNDYKGRENNYYGNLMFQTYFDKESKHQITSGLSYMVDNFDETLNDSTFVRKESVPGGFVEYTYIDPEKFSLILGARTDFHNIYGTLFTPRIHLKYNISENTTLRGSAGRGFRTPNIIAENIYLLAGSRKMNILEEPTMEEAWNFGLNLTQYFKVFDKNLSINLDFYRTEFVNQIVIDRDRNSSNVYIYNLDGKSYSNSLQIESKYELFNRFDLLVAFRYNDVKMTINDELKQKPLVGKFKGLINMSYATNLNKWQFDLTTQLNGKSRLPNTSSNPAEYRLREESPAFTVMNVQITKFFRKWEIYGGVENLTNYTQDNPILAADDPFGEYFDSSLIWGPITGRKFYAGIRYRIKK